MINQKEQTFKIPGVNWRSLSALAIFVAAVLVSMSVSLNRADLPMLIVISVVVFILIAVLLSTPKAMLDKNRLMVGGLIYKVSVPLEKIDLAGVRCLDAKDPFRLRWRMNGIGWPGLSLGWYSSNIDKRIFVASTNKSNRVYIPTSEKFDILATPTDPARFIAELRKVGNAKFS